MPEPLDITTIRRIVALESEIRRLRTYDHGQSIGEVLGTYLFLPALRAFWPFSSEVFNAGGVFYLADVSGHSRHMAAVNAPTYAILDNILPYCVFSAAGSQRFVRPDEPELYPANGYGLTVGCWCRNTTNPTAGNFQGLITKSEGVTPNRGIALNVFNSGSATYARFSVSSDGTAYIAVNHTSALTTAGWHFVVGRYTPSSELAVFDNGVKVTETTAIPATPFRPVKDFCLGAYDNSNDYFDGYMTLAFVCADALGDAILARIFKATRHFFGV